MLDPHDPVRFIGTVVHERYRVTSLIGSGSMSNVYEVEDCESGRVGAMKVLLGGLGKNVELAARLVREGKAMGMFAHPNIVELLDVGVLEDGRPFVITERIRGVSLRALMDAGRVEPLRALAIIRQVLDALEHAHRHGVIHRDIKPANIMLVDGGSPSGEGDVVKVLDFGVAKLVGDTRALLDEATLTRTGYDVFGSPLYIAPESVLGRLVDARTDIYSAGAVLFELLTGRAPFEHEDSMVILRMHASAPVPTLAQRAPERTFTHELEYLVAEALAKQPARRFASATDMMALVDATRASLEAPRGDTLIANSAAAAMRPLGAPLQLDLGTRGRAASSASARVKDWAQSAAQTIKRIPPRRRFTLVAAGLGAILLIAVAASLGGSSKQAVAATTAAPKAATRHDTAALLDQGHADFARGRRLDALTAYERALARSPKLGGDDTLRTNVTAIAAGNDTVAAVVALELLATRVEPPAHEEIVAQASRGKSAEVRHRAFAIAERDGFADSIDRVESYQLDLKDAKNCDERRGAIQKLRTLSDRQAIPAIRRARDRFPCIKREAAEAIADLEVKS